MTDDVIIRIRGTQKADGGEPDEPLEMVAAGKYYFRNGSHYVRYEELLEGYDQPNVNVVKFTSSRLEVIKNGVISANMLFEENKKSLSIYTTPFGPIRMSITATVYRLQEEGKRISVDVRYVLDMNDAHASDCELHMEVLPRDGGFVL